MMLKCMLASDAVLEKVRFPCLLQPKIDGVRAANFTGKLVGRSLEPHGNKRVNHFFSHANFLGMDGEMAGAVATHPDLCRLTTSVMNSYEGPMVERWHVFDYVTEQNTDAPYIQRLGQLVGIVSSLPVPQGVLVSMVKTVRCDTVQQLLYCDEYFSRMGYEGSIIRDPWGLYKHGRSTVREGGLLRLKQFIDAEAEVVAIIEGETNNNEAQLDARGLTKRSTHKANMQKNATIGALLCKVLNEVSYNGSVLFKKGQEIKVGAGRMPHDERALYFQRPEKILGGIIKFKTFPTGVKDKPRFPTFQSVRMKSDM